MFKGEYVSSRKGTSKAGNDYYQVELLAGTLNGGYKVLQEFCTLSAYNDTLSLKPKQEVLVSVGVTDSGHITIDSIKDAKEVEEDEFSTEF